MAGCLSLREITGTMCVCVCDRMPSLMPVKQSFTGIHSFIMYSHLTADICSLSSAS